MTRLKRVRTDAVQSGSASVKSPAPSKLFNKDLIMCVVVLVAIALVSGVLLGALNYVTYVDPNETIMSQIASAYDVGTDAVSLNGDRALNIAGNKSTVNSVFEIKGADGQIAALAYYVTGAGAYDGTVEFVVYIENGEVIDITVYASSETPTIGGKVLSASNLAKLKGIRLADIRDYSSAGSADAKEEDVYISGATMTTKSITNALRAVAYAYNTYEEA